MRTCLIIMSFLAAFGAPAAAQKVITVVLPGTPVPPQPQQQQQQPQRLSPTAAACASEALGKVPQGTQVLASSVGFSHSLPRDEIDFYVVMVKLGLGGQEFSYKYHCRSWAGAIQIMNRELVR